MKRALSRITSTSLYLGGCVYCAKTDVHNNPKSMGLLEEEDYFGEEILETGWPRQTMVETVTDVTLLRISVPQFVSMLEIIQPLAERLQFILDSYRLTLHVHFDWVEPEETVLFVARRHIVILWMMILPSIIVGVLAIPLSALLFLSTGMITALILLLAVIFTVVVWFIWSYIDWTNDYYIVTNQRVLFQEKVLLLYDSRLESPLETVQSTSITTSQWGRWLGFGNVAIRTYIGTILFRDITNPDQVMGFIQEQQVRAQFSQHRVQLRSIRELLDKRIRSGPQPPTPPRAAQPVAKPSGTRQFLSTMFHLRYESGGTVIYRTHWFILLKKVGIPSLILLGMLILFIISAYYQFPILSLVATCGLSIMVGMVIFGWWFYQYLDWHNDLYLITPEQVVDVYKKPLGQEDRKAAPLKNILSIEYRRLGIIGLLLNYGTVFIRVGDQTLTFDDVRDPASVQRELFQHLSKRNFQDKQAQEAAERQRMADWFATYNELSQENRAARTPPPQPPARSGF